MRLEGKIPAPMCFVTELYKGHLARFENYPALISINPLIPLLKVFLLKIA